MIQFENLKECKEYIEFLEAKGREVPQYILDAKKTFETLENASEKEYIFSTMAAHNKYMNSEKETVVREMTDHLMIDGDKAEQPCLLLGKVQCGKTDTFLSIMSLCFDQGIDIAVVLTKGTNTLASQTIERLKSVEKGFGRFLDTNGYNQKIKIDIYDILDLYKRGGLSTPQLNDPSRKFIIVVKKETVNMQYLINLFEENELMRTKNVLVCDDEADFASRAYLTKKKSKTEKEINLLKIAEHIETFIKLPKLCRYLQITATPYSLYLQPDGTVKIREGEEASCWLPRYTGLVPIHDKYVGGRQYFIDSQKYDIDTDPENPKPLSMYCLLYENVTEECMDVLSARNEWYREANIHSEYLTPLNKAIITYIFATAVRVIQNNWAYDNATPEERKKMKKYRSSCLIHCEMAKAKHKWQEDLITDIIENFRKNIVEQGNSDLHILKLENEAYESLKKSNELAKQEGLITESFPSFAEVESEVKRLMDFKDYKISVVNSDNHVRSMLNDEGQLKLEQTINFFIGGSILDRGITIDNMLCFFYGRNPGKFQMDTVLQHARMYGARDKEDMACTRFFTSQNIYDVLRTINEFDDYIYEYLKNNRNKLQTDEFTSIVIGYDKRISPSAQNKYTPANTQVLKPNARTYPVGFQTLEPDACMPITEEIDSIIAQAQAKNNPDANGYFLMEYVDAVRILNLIEESYVYSPEYHNVGLEWDNNDMITPLDHFTFDTDGMILARVLKNRNLSRERDDVNDKRGRFVDAPETGSEVRLDRQTALDRPVLTFTRQNGNKDKGWMGCLFYWAILTNPLEMRPGIFTINGNKHFRNVERKQFYLDTPRTLPQEDILRLTIRKGFFFDIISGKKKDEVRELKRTTSKLFIDTDFFGNPILIEGADQDKYYDLSSYNDGIFPWEIKKYKYIYFRCSADYSGSQALVEIDHHSPYTLVAEQGEQKDIIYDTTGEGTEAVDNDVAKWTIVYHLGKLIEKKLTAADEKEYKQYLGTLGI